MFAEHIIRERELKTLAKRKARVMARRKRRAEEKASRNQVDQELLERVVQYALGWHIRPRTPDLCVFTCTRVHISGPVYAYLGTK